MFDPVSSAPLRRRPSQGACATFLAGVLLALVAACGGERLMSHPAVSTAPMALAPIEGEPKEPGGTRRPGRRHLIRPGDTLWSISRDYGVGIQALMRANGITPQEVTRLEVGRTLRIPVGGSSIAPTTSAPAHSTAARSTATRPASTRAPTVPRAMLLADAHLGQARDRYDAADFEGALADAQRAGRLLAGMEDDPAVRARRARALLLEGMAEAALGKADRARASFREAQLLDPHLSLDPTTTSPKLITLFEQAAAQP